MFLNHTDFEEIWLVWKEFSNKFQKSNFSIFPEDGQQDGICSFTDKQILENLEVPRVWKISIPHLLQNLKLQTDFLNVSICLDWRENFRLLLGRASTKVKRITAIKTLRFILDLMRFFMNIFLHNRTDKFVNIAFFIYPLLNKSFFITGNYFGTKTPTLNHLAQSFGLRLIW